MKVNNMLFMIWQKSMSNAIYGGTPEVQRFLDAIRWKFVNPIKHKLDLSCTCLPSSTMALVMFLSTSLYIELVFRFETFDYLLVIRLLIHSQLNLGD